MKLRCIQSTGANSSNEPQILRVGSYYWPGDTEMCALRASLGYLCDNAGFSFNVAYAILQFLNVPFQVLFIDSDDTDTAKDRLDGLVEKNIEMIVPLDIVNVKYAHYYRYLPEPFDSERTALLINPIPRHVIQNLPLFKPFKESVWIAATLISLLVSILAIKLTSRHQNHQDDHPKSSKLLVEWVDWMFTFHFRRRSLFYHRVKLVRDTALLWSVLVIVLTTLYKKQFIGIFTPDLHQTLPFTSLYEFMASASLIDQYEFIWQRDSEVKDYFRFHKSLYQHWNKTIWDNYQVLNETKEMQNYDYIYKHVAEQPGRFAMTYTSQAYLQQAKYSHLCVAELEELGQLLYLTGAATKMHFNKSENLTLAGMLTRQHGLYNYFDRRTYRGKRQAGKQGCLIGKLPHDQQKLTMKLCSSYLVLFGACNVIAILTCTIEYCTTVANHTEHSGDPGKEYRRRSTFVEIITLRKWSSDGYYDVQRRNTNWQI